MKPHLEQPTWLSVTDIDIPPQAGGPRRYLAAPAGEFPATLKTAHFLAAESEKAIQARLAWLKTTRQKRLFFGLASLWNITRNFPAIRRADIIQCQGPHYFWWLAGLHRAGLLSARRQLIFAVFFRGDPLLRRMQQLRRIGPRFHAFLVSHEQIQRLQDAGAPPERMSYFTCRIDTAWFRPTSAPTGGYLLVPGNIHRDERFVLALARESPVPIIRVGQIGGLRDVYRNAGVELRFNTSHEEYLELLQNATAVLLPIEPCDEPAGLTAALEALACEVPLLANISLELPSLLRTAAGVAAIPDLKIETWLASIREVLSGTLYPPEVRGRAREHLTRANAIPPGGAHWQPVLELFAAQRAACYDPKPSRSP